ncbi:DNA helicase RecQ [Pyramidobacter sp. SM-530-WT-4B]|uniref:DNA helicase RecQ n=1 Tax=Pyramidobacter porci TaxID=2605789 RepID=A0A6L5YAS1_9BACT|nr:DNA helicase RecQ [Pyramidobacter porci]MST54567.1 DNA helicase RecQ [Pyramidobacter porci]
MDEKLKILKQYFGYSSFRPGQEKTIDALLGGRDTFAVMPTGAGKSICYQIPALLGRGVSLVVSPLVSLMKDQVMSLVQMGVKAAYINSSLTPAQIRVVLDRACGGQYKIIYVAPERLLTGGFLQFAQNAPIDYVTVDEAHCVSKWGQDFRPSYLDVRTFVSGLPKRPVLGAFTATATAEVRKDVVDLLGLDRPYKVVTGFDRKNLFYEVRRPTDRRAELLRIVKDFSGRSGIVYCATRKNVDEICEMLRDRNVPAARYHAGLDDAERSRSQDDFVNDRVGVMVATNAFGMGIDKSNVSYVVHYNMPGDMESYYQEAGRAGRDGEPAWCILLYGAQDVRTQLFFIERMGENSETAAGNLNELQELARLRLKGMIDYCFTSGCLRAYILKYFGEEPPARCDNCGNCQRVLEQVDVTIDAQKILSCVKRAHEAWGVKVIMDVLRGSKAAKLRENGLDGLTTYGIMADVSEQRLRDTIFYLTQEKYLASSGGQYPRLILGERAAEVLRDRKNITAPLPQIESRTVRGEKKKRMQAQMTSGSRPELYERLKALRFEIARAKGVPAFMVFTNAALTDMSEKMPRNIDEFLEISGVGERKAAEYGERFVAAIADWLSERRPSAGKIRNR